ncbi:MAG TPA: DGQHR domain-containing protein [Chloroflexia bacterium]|nr:DGQHR domain-containing protein [Chloroflexia bacterium]
MSGFKVTAHVLKQKGYKLYLFPMNSGILRQVCYVTPRTKDNPQEVQRVLNTPRAKEVGEYIKQPTSLLPNAIVVSLTDEVTISNTGNPDEVVISFPSDQGKFAYILDGQHRLGGFSYSDSIQFDLPVVALHNASETIRTRIFADINSKQVKVDDVHLLQSYYQIKALPPEEMTTMDIVERLAKDPDSPLQGKIRLRSDEKGMWVTNKHMKMCLAPYVEGGGSLYTYGQTVADRAQVIKEYLVGVRQVWPDAWGDNTNYMLTRPMGIELIMSVFDVVKHRCDLNHGRQYTAEAFAQSLEPLTRCEIQLPGSGRVPLTWERGPVGVGSMSNRAGITLITKQLKNHLRQADNLDP